jgi:hypothetical protein
LALDLAKNQYGFQSVEKSAKNYPKKVIGRKVLHTAVKVKKLHFSVVTFSLITFSHELVCNFYTGFEISVKFCVLILYNFLHTLKANADETAEKNGKTFCYKCVLEPRC